MSIYYHVTKRWNGGDLETLFSRCGGNENKALNTFVRKYRHCFDSFEETIDLGKKHIYYVHLWDKKSDAIEMAEEIRGQILKIDDKEDELVVINDPYEFIHPMTRDTIPANMITKLSSHRKRCSHCNGSGVNPLHSKFDCPKCFGKGYVLEYY